MIAFVVYIGISLCILIEWISERSNVLFEANWIPTHINLNVSVNTHVEVYMRGNPICFWLIWGFPGCTCHMVSLDGPSYLHLRFSTLKTKLQMAINGIFTLHRKKLECNEKINFPWRIRKYILNSVCCYLKQAHLRFTFQLWKQLHKSKLVPFQRTVCINQNLF